MALPVGATERFVPADGLRFHVDEAGPADGSPVVLLHGFPELWHGWRGQSGALADAGLRVIVPDQRGYNLSDKPRGVGAYSVETLAADVASLLDACGLAQASIVGHDWGAVVAWWLGLAHPERVSRLGILNVPHPAVMRRNLMSSPRQMARSWYVFFFQLPRLPERFLARDGFANLARANPMTISWLRFDYETNSIPSYCRNSIIVAMARYTSQVATQRTKQTS